MEPEAADRIPQARENVYVGAPQGESLRRLWPQALPCPQHRRTMEQPVVISRPRVTFYHQAVGPFSTPGGPAAWV